MSHIYEKYNVFSHYSTTHWRPHIQTHKLARALPVPVLTPVFDLEVSPPSPDFQNIVFDLVHSTCSIKLRDLQIHLMNECTEKEAKIT